MKHVLSQRGFKFMEPIETPRNEWVELSESSAAEGPHVWLRVNVDPHPSGYTTVEPGRATAHLTLKQLRLLRDQATWLLKNHYQVERKAKKKR